jgi:hypothetical protein
MGNLSLVTDPGQNYANVHHKSERKQGRDSRDSCVVGTCITEVPRLPGSSLSEILLAKTTTRRKTTSDEESGQELVHFGCVQA